MNRLEVVEKLGIPADRLERMKGQILKMSNWPEPQLFRFDKAVSGVEAGTVIFDNNEIVHGYPKIRRAMMLEPAIKKHFSKELIAEEKMNGHNVRVVEVDGQMVALTRGGFICPYSTEVASRQIPQEVFEDHPDLVLCGEMVGPNNPYVPKKIYPVEFMDFYLFDISSKGSRDLGGSQRTHRLAREYGIRDVPLLGRFEVSEASEKVRDIIKQLGHEGREGVVLKDPENKVNPMKYTCSESNCVDLEFAFRYYNDYGQDFFFSRVVREGFQAAEWGDSENEFRERCLRLGQSLLGPMRETVEAKMNNVPIVQKVQIKVEDLQTARDFEEHLRRMGMRATFDWPEPCEDGYLVGITRVAMSTNDKTRSVIEGHLW